MKKFGDQRDWFFEKRYGLFVHWGLYAIHGWHEQEQWRNRVPRSEYVGLKEQWNPTAFDPDAWLDLAESAGMEYIILTAKHHDGFCLFDTAETDYHVVNTPYGRDIVGQLAAACHRRGVPLGLYYSVVDWHQPNYPNQGRHHEIPPQQEDTPDIGRYIDFMRRQVRELCTQYGPIHSFWWDQSEHVRTMMDPDEPSLNDLIRQLQPACVINNNGIDPGDMGILERDFNPAVDDVLRFEHPIEACQSVGMMSWGYRREESYYTDRHLVRGIDTTLAKGGNYLLNVGPRPDGTIPEKARAMLMRIGAWMGSVRESLYEAEPASSFTTNRDVLLTRRGNDLFVHLCNVPKGEDVVLPGITLSPRSAILLNTGEALQTAENLLPNQHRQRTPCLRIRNVPVNQLGNTVPVVRLRFDHLPATPPFPVTELADHDTIDVNLK